MRRSGVSRWLVALVAITTFIGGGVASAQTIRTWNNPGDSDWRTGANWSPTGIPGPNDIAQFSDTYPAVSTSSGNVPAVGISGSLNFTVQVGAVQLNSGSVTSGLQIGNSSSNDGTLQLNGAMLNGQANTILWNNTANVTTLELRNGVQGGTNSMFPTLGQTASVIQMRGGTATAFGNGILISAAISENNAGSSITVLGGGSATVNPGTLTLAAAHNFFTGGITVGDAAGANAARLALTTPTAILGNNGTPVGNLVINPNSQLRLDAATGTFGVTGQVITVNSLGTPSAPGGIRYELSSGTGGNVTVAANVTLAGPSRVAVVGGSNLVTFAGVVSGPGSLTKEGTGILVMQGGGSFTGPTTVNTGTLASSGTVSSAVTVNTGGTINPGPGTGALGSNTFNPGTVTFVGGRYLWNVNQLPANGSAGVNWGLLNITGQLILGPGTPTFSVAGTVANWNPTPATPYHWTVATTSGGVSGDPATFTIDTSQFTNPIGSGYGFSLSTSGTNLVLDYGPVPVPEPAHVLLICASAGCLLHGRRWAGRAITG
jgi:autotransporter-associated beta strand protein